MGQDFSRTRRIGEELRKELAVLIQREVKDPRVQWVTIAGVEVSRDLAHANVFYTALGQEEENREITQGLKKATGFLRRELGKRIRLRTIPELHFVFDKSFVNGQRLSALIDEAVKADEKAKEQ